MIKFDAANLTVEIVFIKQITTALGGSLLFLTHPNQTLKQAVRIVIPTVVARNFINRYQKITRYLNSVPVAVVKYNGMVVSLERHHLGALGIDLDNPSGCDAWTPYCTSNIELTVPKMTSKGDWYFDGRYAYTHEYTDKPTAIGANSSISKDHSFKVIKAGSIDLYNLQTSKELTKTTRECIAYLANNGMYSISSPLWVTARSIGSSSSDNTDVENEDIDIISEQYNDVSFVELEADNPNHYWLDVLDATTQVNLAFALFAGTQLGRVFEYSKIDALRLPELMVELQTINLPNIASSVKSTYPIGLQFKQAVAWLLGMLRDEGDINKVIRIQQCLKYLCKRGTFKQNMFSGIFIGANAVPVLDVAAFKITQEIS